MIVVFFFDRKKICGSLVGFLWSKVKNVRLKVAQPEADCLHDNLSMKVDYHVTSLILSSHVLMNKSGFANLIIYWQT